MHDDPIRSVLSRLSAVHRLSEEAGEHSSERRAAERLTFDHSFYEEVRLCARCWKNRAGVYTQMAVLVPAGIFAFGEMFSFPDKDISFLGIGNHRFFLFHSGAAVWAIRKVYEAQLARTGDSRLLRDRVDNKILGVMASGAAFGVGCHLLVDTLQPKSIVFPFFGSLVQGTLIDDDLWLLANGLWCFKMGADMFALALGDDLPKVKAWVQRTLVEPIAGGLQDAISGVY